MENEENLDEKSLKSPDYIFEPNQSEIVNELLPKALSIKFLKLYVIRLQVSTEQE